MKDLCGDIPLLCVKVRRGLAAGLA
jgi:hypothetical protein